MSEVVNNKPMSVCPKCGLPEELCTCSQLILEEQVAKVKVVKRRYGKPVTLITGINFDELGQTAVKELIKNLTHIDFFQRSIRKILYKYSHIIF